MSTVTARFRLNLLASLRRRGVQSLVGIEAGESWLRFAQQRRHDGAESWSVAGVQVTSGGLDGSKQAGRRLQGLARQAGISRGPATCAISSASVDVFPLTLKRAEPEMLDNLVVSQARDQLGYPIGEAVLDYAVLPNRVTRTGQETTAVLAFATPRALAETMLQTLGRAGFTVNHLLTPACVLAPRVAVAEPDARQLLIATGEGATSVSVIEGGHVLLERILPWSLQRLVQRLQAELDLAEVQCRALLMPGRRPQRADASDALADDASAGPLESTLRAILDPSFQELTRETTGCVGYCNSVFQPKEISSVVLVGPLAGHGPLREFLARGLELPVLGASAVVGVLGWEKLSDAAEYATAACCALWSGEAAA